MVKKTDNEKFKAAMERNGLKVRLYKGRWFWKGYGVSIERYNLQEVMSFARVGLQHETLGLGYIVYPVQSMTDEEWETAKQNWKDEDNEEEV